VLFLLLMLGSQSWYTALAVPTIIVGGFVATRKRLAYQWREELMDPEGTTYPTVTDADMEFLRRVAPAAAVAAAETFSASQKAMSSVPPSTSTTSSSSPSAEEAFGVRLTKCDNIGLNVRSGILPPEVRNVLLNEVQRWSQAFGNSLDQRKVVAIERHLQAAMASDAALPGDDAASSSNTAMPNSAVHTARGKAKQWLSFSFLHDIRVIADHAEDIQAMKAPWGCGDRIRLEQMPASLRYLVHHTQHAFEGMGRLRHVYIEYSPSGEFYRAPRPPKMYDGHDYVVIPLRRDDQDTVVTMSPVLRSRVSDLREVALNSWTTRDVDALVPAGCMLRVYGTARYEWGWGMRPGPVWFGSRLNPVPLNSSARELIGSTHSHLKRWGWRRLARPITSLWNRNSGVSTSDNNNGGRVSVPMSTAPRDAALIVLHYEGPRASKKQRSLLLQPEMWIFGRPPSVETFETWYEDRPSADSVREEGVLRFMIRNYFDMLTVS
jgi:hypothetical protein